MNWLRTLETTICTLCGKRFEKGAYLWHAGKLRYCQACWDEIRKKEAIK